MNENDAAGAANARTSEAGRMASVAVITPSYSPDFELCRDLHMSVLQWTAPEVKHHIIVPKGDLSLFRQFRGDRCEVWAVDAIVPRRFRKLPWLNGWMNLRRPFPPVRGWVMQQIVKLAAPTVVDADELLYVDSDIALIRPVSAESFSAGDGIPLYRVEGGVHVSMSRHVRWDQNGRRLLGLPPDKGGPLPDYVSPLNLWNRAAVLALQSRLEEVGGRPWADVVGRTVHVSEFVLYGLFVEHMLQGMSPMATMHCHTYWEEEPLTLASGRRFLEGMGSDTLAVMISAKSRTPLDVRRELVRNAEHLSATIASPARPKAPSNEGILRQNRLRFR